MREDRTFEKLVIGAIALAGMLLAIGWLTREDPAEKPYLRIAGGGFIYNYRVADVFYGFTAYVLKPLPVETRLHARSVKYGIRSPSVRGVKAGRPYRVSIRIVDYTRTQVIWSDERDYVSQIDDMVVPDKPLTVGPGYHPNPDLVDG
ncbi:hypothetical protein [uncultured Hoeflea sp.]|uniref:hypothetical protein n=1 Tax=uncultured Hoeflea sp. TaxID=538666 RepID=UPI00262C31ED|nr:hypothetical protein [uncultured Hoeflea sp.]